MAKIRMQRRHRLELADIRARADGLAAKLVSKFGGEYRWQDDSLYYSRRGGVDARIVCTSEDIVVDVNLGLMMSALRGLIEAEIRYAFDEYLV